MAEYTYGTSKHYGIHMFIYVSASQSINYFLILFMCQHMYVYGRVLSTFKFYSYVNMLLCMTVYMALLIDLTYHYYFWFIWLIQFTPHEASDSLQCTHIRRHIITTFKGHSMRMTHIWPTRTLLCGHIYSTSLRGSCQKCLSIKLNSFHAFSL